MLSYIIKDFPIRYGKNEGIPRLTQNHNEKMIGKENEYWNHKLELELEDRLMDLLEIISDYEGLPLVYFNTGFDEILRKLENIDI